MVITDVRQIERMPLTHTDDIEKELRGELLTKAFEEFNYSADEFGGRGPLAKVLQKLDIAPLKKEQVMTYMESKKWESPELHSIIRPIVILLTTVGAYLIDLHILNKTIGTSDRAWELMDYVFMGLFDSIGIFVSSLILCGIIDVTVPNMKVAKKWKWFVLGKTKVQMQFKKEVNTLYPYRRYVPIHILSMALEIRKEVPSAIFSIAELTKEVYKIPQPLPDPFLCVSCGSESYYIAVWDEREFEAKM